MSANEKFESLQLLFPDAQLLREGGVDLAFLPRIKIENQGKQAEVEALLWPSPRDGYPTRLFLNQKLTAPEAKNWNSFVIAGRTWWACSWKDVSNALSWAKILAGHLRAFL